MEVHLDAAHQAQLADLSSRKGKAIEEVASEILSRSLDEEAQFEAAVREGFASLDRGEHIEHEEVKARLERLIGT